MENSLSEIQLAINEILNVKSLIRKKKKTRVEKKKELFISIINSIEQIINRQNLMYAELNLDLTKYDESFLDVIDALLVLHFGKDGADLVGYYLWERLAQTETLIHFSIRKEKKFTYRMLKSFGIY